MADSPPVDNRAVPIPAETTALSEGASADTRTISAYTSVDMTEMPADSSETSCSRPLPEVPTNSTLVSANTTEVSTAKYSISVCTTEAAADSTATGMLTSPYIPLAMEMGELCRLCLVHCALEMQRLFDDAAFSGNIMALAQIQMCEGDGLPDRVCQHCLHQMKASLEFVAKVRSSDLTLKECMHKLQLGAAVTVVREDSTASCVDGETTDASSRSSILSNLLQRPCSRKNVKQADGSLCARRSMAHHSYAQQHNNNNNNNNNNSKDDVLCRYLNAKCCNVDNLKPKRGVNGEATRGLNGEATRDVNGETEYYPDKPCRLRLNPLHSYAGVQAPVPLDDIEAQLDLLLNGGGGAKVDLSVSPGNRWRVECDSVALALCKLQREAKTVRRKTVEDVLPASECLLRDSHASKNGLARSLLSPRNLPCMQRNVTVCFNNVATKVEANVENDTESEVNVPQESAVNVAAENVVIVALIDASSMPTVQEAACNGQQEEHSVKVECEDEMVTGDYCAEEASHVTTTDKAFNSGEIFYFDVQEEVIISDDVVCEEVVTEEADLEPDAVLPSTSSAILDCEVLPADVGDYIFACEMCSKSFKRKKALLSHVKMHTLIKSYGSAAESKRDDSRPVFKCDVCFKCYISKAGLKIHRSKAHTEGNALCPECEQVFDSKADLAGHLKTFKHKELRCNRCLKTFVKRQAFVAHTHIHPQFVYKCATCMKTFAEEAELKEHAVTHKVHDAATGNTVKTEAQVEQFQRMKFDYCLSYVGLVKTMFATQPERYMAFLDTIKDFKFKKLNVDSLLVRISQLFKDHRELIAGFNTFMPHGFKIELPPEDSKLGVSSLSGMSPAVTEDPTQPQGPDMDLDYSLSYLSQIKSMFATQPKIYNDFTFIIKEYKLKTMEIPEVIRRVSHLFRDYPELIAGFNSFLPPWCKINVSVNVKKEKEDIDPLASGSCSSTANGSAESSKPRYGDNGAAATANQNSAKRAKRRNSSHYNTVSKKVKMEVISNDNLFKTINHANNVSEHNEEGSLMESEDIVEVPSVPSRPKSIVETITSLCHQLQTMVDKDLPGQSQAGENITYAHEGEESTQEEDDIPAEIHSFVCHVCLKSFNKKQLLTDHVKLHQFKS